MHKPKIQADQVLTTYSRGFQTIRREISVKVKFSVRIEISILLQVN